MTWKRRLLGGTLLLAVALALLWAAHAPLLRAMARWLDVGEPPRPAEYVMVLNGCEDTRPLVAAALVGAGFARHALVAEVAPSPAADYAFPPCHEINRQVLLRRGVPESDITVLPAAALSTYDEAETLAAFLRDRPNSRVLVVTSDCHTRRSRWIFARTLAERADQLWFVSAPSDDFGVDDWWRAETGFITIVMEYLKFAFYVARYGHLGYWLAACGLLAVVAAWIRRRERGHRENGQPSVPSPSGRGLG
jgi:uncharacterized SAM-binding protein YcdF (DUF218 family)